MSDSAYQKCPGINFSWYAKVGGSADVSLGDLKKHFLDLHEEYSEAEVNPNEGVKEAFDIFWYTIGYHVRFSNLQASKQIDIDSFLVGIDNCRTFLEKAEEIFDGDFLFDEYEEEFTIHISECVCKP